MGTAANQRSLLEAYQLAAMSAAIAQASVRAHFGSVFGTTLPASKDERSLGSAWRAAGLRPEWL